MEMNEVERWMAKRRTVLILSILREEITIQEAARKHDLTINEVESW